MIGEYADWALEFTSNEICIAYSSESAFADQIDAENWYKILSDPSVRYGRSDPNADPCGYRTILSLKLANRFCTDEIDDGQWFDSSIITARVTRNDPALTETFKCLWHQLIFATPNEK